VFSSIFDSSNNAIHVTCISGCGGVFGTDLSPIDASHQKVVGINSIPLSTTAPANGQVFQYSSSQNQWVPVTMGSFVAGGDLTGSPSSQTVAALQGKPLAASSPASNQVLSWNGSAWTPVTPAAGAGTGTCGANQFVTGVILGSSPNCTQPGFSSLSGTATAAQLPAASSSAQGAVKLAQDLSGSATAPKVAGLQGNPVSSTAPTANQVLTWNGTNWVPTTPTASAGTGTCGANQFVTGVILGSSPNCTQPAFSSLIGTAIAAQLPAATAAAQGALQLAQDLTGTAAAPKVAGLQGNPVSSTTPASNQILTWNGTAWAPANAPATGAQISQDLGGTTASPKVVGLQGNPVSSSAPTSNQVLTWNGTTWVPTTPTAGAGTGTCSANQFVTGVILGSAPNCTQPAFSSLTGTATAAQLPAASSSAQGALQLAQDLTGSAVAPKVAGLQGNPVASTTPTSNQVLTWNGTAWAPSLPSFATLSGAASDAQLASAYSGVGACPSNQFATTLARNGAPTCSAAVSASTASAGQFATGISAGGVLSYAQPSFSNLSGSLALNQTPLTANGDLLTVSGGTLSRLPMGSANQCFQVNSTGTGYQFGPCATGGSGAPGGSNAQVQFNNSGAFGGATSFTYNTGSGAVSVAALSDAVTLALSPSTATGQLSDVFQVYQQGASPSTTCATNSKCAFAVQSNGNLFFAGNSATYGAASQTSQSSLRLYGSVSSGSNLAPAYFQFLSGTGSAQTNLFSSISQNGILCAGSSIPGGDCGAGQQLTLNPMTTSGDLIVGGSAVLGTAQPTRLPIGSFGQCLQVLSGLTLGYSTCGSGTVTSVGLSLPAGFTVGSSPVTTSGTLSVTGPLTTEGDLPYYHSSAWARLGVGTNGQCLTSNGTDPLWASCGAGSVTSVGLSLPSIFSVSGTPVTSTGTLTGTLATQSANLVWAGPASGVAAAPVFRSLVKADQYSTTVYSDQGNTWTAGAQDMSAAASYRVPVAAGLTATVNGQIGYDSTASVPHMAVNSADAKLATFTVTPATGDCVQWISTTQIGDQGSPCGTGGGGTLALSSLTPATASNAIANGNSPQTWNWAQTTASQSGLTLGETSAATGTGDNEVKISTQGNSTATPLNVAQGAITNTTSIPALNVTSTYNNSGLTGTLISAALTNTSSVNSLLLNLLAGASGTTSEFSVSAVGTAKASGFQGGSGSAFEGNGTTIPITFQGGQDVSANSGLGGATLRGGNQTGAGGSSSAGGYVLVQGGSNAATNASSSAGSAEIGPGQSTGLTQGLQGLYAQYFSYIKGATVTQWNVECFSSSMTTADCAASPGNWIGIAEVLNTNTVQVIASGQVPVNSSNPAAVGDTFCAGATAGKGTDSGGTVACVLGTQIGVVAAVSGTYKLPDGTSFTASTSLPLIQIARD
jgi:hypothetical protein